jgi:hypothetical protein
MSEETDTLRPVRVAKKTTEAHQMVTFELVDPEGAELPRFPPDLISTSRSPRMDWYVSTR